MLASPQLLRRSLQLVVPARDSQLRTVLVDVGYDVVCLDVTKAQAGQAILQALELLYPGRSFRLDVSSSQTLRHGDVIYGFEDRFERFEIGPVAWPTVHTASFSIRCPGPEAAEDIIVSAVDFDLLHLKVPLHTSVDTLNAVLTQWLGRQRCLDLPLHRLALPSGLPRAFCLPGRHKSTMTVILFDLVDCTQPVLAHTIDIEGRQAPSPIDLCMCPKHGPMWTSIFMCRPECLYRSSTPATMTRTGFGHEQLFIAVDLGRAGLFGLGLTTAMRPSSWDIQARASSLQVQHEIVQDAHRQEAASQTLPAHWHPAASPLYSAALPIRKAAAACILDATFPSVGTLFHLECPLMGVHCTIPCHSRRHIWALRTEDVVRGLCTPEVSWAVLIEVLGISAWDLPGTIVHNGHDVWEWPDDLSQLAGTCGHVFERETQLKGGHTICYPQPLVSAGPPPGPLLPGGTAAAAGGSLALSSRRLWSFVLLGWAVSLPTAAAVSSPPTADAASPASGLIFDPTQTCNVGWCHELACQATHFATSTGRLAEYFRRRSPFQTVRVLLWQPFRGPSAFDVQRDAPSVVLAQTLAAAGHDAATRQLFVAFDSQATTIDILSIPYGHSIWWIIRDGLSRELLRPVAPWYHDREVRVVTVNSHGQASAVIYSAEVATLKRLPQGARGIASEPLTRVIGHLTSSGLTLTEVAIGTVTGLAFGAGPRWLLLLLCMHSIAVVRAMQPAPAADLPVVPSHTAAWSDAAPPPTCTRVWTHTLAAPIVIPYDPSPCPARMSQAVAGTCRGVAAPGDFTWTVPQVVQGCAHILHFPVGNNPPAVYWLLHYCARAVVIGVHPGPVDWTNLGQQAYDAFGVDCFVRGHFGVQFSNKVVRYGQHLHAPPHGAILHLIKVPPLPAGSGQGWDPPPDPLPIRSFEYDICMGPRDEVPIPRLQGDAVARGHPVGTATRRAAPQEPAADVNALAKQLTVVTSHPA